jgi:hypothetical protein
VSGADERLEVVATILLALATVGTAWSGYQASRWNGEQAKAAARANAARIESTKAAARADAQTQIDVATFTAWVDAYAQKQTELADFYFKRFRAEFKPAVDAWVATRPLKNPDAPLTPFAMSQYKLAARTDISRSTNYVLAVVLFAAVLFFAGMSTKLREAYLRRLLLGLGVVVFLATVVWLATSPVSVPL